MLVELGRGAPHLNPALVLCQNVSRRQPPASVDPLFVLTAVLIVAALLTLPFTLAGLLIWLRQAVRRRLGLPEPATARADTISPA